MTLVMLGAILFVFGVFNGAMDVLMNVHGVVVECELLCLIMFLLYGGWSFGGFVFLGLVVIVGAVGFDLCVESLIVGILLWFVMVFWIGYYFGSVFMHLEGGNGFVLLLRVVLLIGFLCFLVMMTEGVIGDWSGIYFK